MDKLRYSLEFSTKFTEVRDINPFFAYGKMRIAYTGRNRNMTSISKEVFEDGLPTMFNCPLVARYDRDTNTFGSHDIEVVVKDGKLAIVNATTPIGVIPTGAQYAWETIEEEDGTQHEYLTCDVILWKRQQEAYAHLMELETVAQSMECEFTECHYDEDGYCVADKLIFSAFCLLESAQPCFESANVQVFAKDAEMYEAQFQQMLADFKDMVSEPNMLGFDINQDSMKGGNGLLMSDEVRDAILSEFNMSLDELDFEFSDMTEEEFRANLEQSIAPEDTGEGIEATSVEVVAEVTDTGSPEVEPEAEPPAEAPDVVNAHFATFNQKYNALCEALSTRNAVVKSPDGREVSDTYYWLSDFDEQYVYAGCSIWTLDDGCSNTQGRFGYSYDEEANEATITGEFEEMVVRWLTIEESQKLEQSRQTFEELKQFREERLAADHRAEVDGVIAEFGDIAETEEFAALGEGVYEFAIDSLKEKLFAIRGRNTVVKTAKSQAKPVVAPILSGAAKEESRYGDLFTRYGSLSK